jgi:hypothetical protein
MDCRESSGRASRRWLCYFRENSIMDHPPWLVPTSRYYLRAALFRTGTAGALAENNQLSFTIVGLGVTLILGDPRRFNDRPPAFEFMRNDLAGFLRRARQNVEPWLLTPSRSQTSVVSTAFRRGPLCVPLSDIADEIFRQSRMMVSAKTAATRHPSSSIDGVMSQDD